MWTRTLAALTLAAFLTLAWSTGHVVADEAQPMPQSEGDVGYMPPDRPAPTFFPNSNCGNTTCVGSYFKGAPPFVDWCHTTGGGTGFYCRPGGTGCTTDGQRFGTFVCTGGTWVNAKTPCPNLTCPKCQ